MQSYSELLTKDWINLVVLIRTAKKTKRVKKTIKAKSKGDISISPNETMNKSDIIFKVSPNKIYYKNTKALQ